MPPELDQMNPDMSAQAATLPSGETDREGAMAKADLYKLANYSHKLFQQIQDEDQLEGWVQAKITKAADYIASVYHYLEYEMKFSEYGKALDDSDVLSEGQKRVLKTRLMEAKVKVKELKKVQAEKVKDKSMAEGVISGGHTACAECGGSGMVYEEPKAIPDHVKSKVAKYKRQATAFHAAGKRIDANKNGIPDDEEMAEDSTEDTTKTTKTQHGTATATFGADGKRKGVKHTDERKYYDGGDDMDTDAKSGKGKASHAKAQSAAEKKDRAPAQKQSPKSAKTWGMKDSEKFDNRDGAPAKPKKPKEEKTDETYGQGVYEAAKLKGGQKKLDTNNDNDIDAKDLAALRAKKKVKEDSHQAKTTMKHVNASNANDKTKAAIGKAAKDIKPGIKGYKDREDAMKAAGVEDDRGPVKESAKQTSSDKKPCPPMSHVKKMCQDGKSVAEICKMHPDCDQKELKQMVADCKKKLDEHMNELSLQTMKSAKEKLGTKAVDAHYSDDKRSARDYAGRALAMGAKIKRKERSELPPVNGDMDSDTDKKKDVKEDSDKIAAVAMWKNMKETVAYIAEKKKQERVADEGNEFSGALKKAREQGDTEMTVDGKSVPVKPGKPIAESAELNRMKEFLTRLNG